MSRTVYVNGEYLAEEEARVSVFDRAFLFGDGVYEVTSVLDGKLIDNPPHLARLRRSLREISLSLPLSDREIEEIQLETVRRNALREGGLYLQVSRHAPDRDFAISPDCPTTLVMFTQARSIVDNPKAQTGLSVITMQDIRWRRRDIKTVQLLAPSLAKTASLDAGADDAWFVEGEHVTEGTSNNAWIVQQNRLVTRRVSNDILAGITRRAVMSLAEEAALEVVERPFTIDEALSAQEAFVTSASAFVLPVVRIDGQAIGDGQPGPVTCRLRALYIQEARAA